VAVSVAVDQAALRQSVSEMYVNMARRSQSLVDRQLTLIDELERYEADAVRLEQLFKRDHLATRMRRNAESLIVLSGSEPGHRWNEAVPLTALLRAAVSEIEDYPRVRVLPIPPIAVVHAGVDVAHLLAELIENAASLSPPQTAVLVAREVVSSGYLVGIEDRGIGMSDAELLAGNQRLGNPPVADVTVSRMLGFYVVGRLAQRHGIKVQLRHSPHGGITALVLLPVALLSRDGADSGQEPALHGRPRGLRGALPRRSPMIAALPRPEPPSGPGDPPLLALEWREIALLCEQPAAVAEIAARLRVPLGVGRVLVADMVAEGLLSVTERRGGPQGADPAVLGRVIDGLRSM
jgi:hypothetical protein